MKRNWDLIRLILLACEEAPPSRRLGEDDFQDQDKAELFEHVRMLTEAGYIKSSLLPDHTGKGGGKFMILRLDWDGHDLLAKMKSETWWEKIKSMAAEKGLALTFDVIKVLAMPAVETLLGHAKP